MPPAVISPLIRKAFSRSAAIIVRTWVGPPISRARAVRISPSNSTSPSSSSARQIVTYSRRCESGFSKGMPQVPSIAGLWEGPSPRIIRPGAIWSTVAAPCAIEIGWRG